MKTAFITGITGQDGSYLAEILLEKDYRVFGFIRRSSTFNTYRIDHLIEKYSTNRFSWYRGDLTDSDSIYQALEDCRPDEIYHLGAQSHVGVSFEMPVYTYDTVATGTLRLLEAAKKLNLNTKIYLAGSSEMFGSANPPQSESTPFEPCSPYAAAKVAGFYLGKHYREGYGMKVYNGILFNHESPRRGETFVTRKITRAAARIAHGLQHNLVLGNLDAKRDWGFAAEYVMGMWSMMNKAEPGDYVLSTNTQYSVREFVNSTFNYIGVEVDWTGCGLNEAAIVTSISDQCKASGCKLSVGDKVVEVSEQYFRPAEVNSLLGDCSKSEKAFGWKANVDCNQLMKMMVDSDMSKCKLLLDGTRNTEDEWREYLI